MLGRLQRFSVCRGATNIISHLGMKAKMEFIFGKNFEREILGLDMPIQYKDWILLALLQAVCECAVCKRTWVCSFAYQVYSVYDNE